MYNLNTEVFDTIYVYPKINISSKVKRDYTVPTSNEKQ